MKVVEYWHETIKNYRYDGDVSCTHTCIWVSNQYNYSMDNKHLSWSCLLNLEKFNSWDISPNLTLTFSLAQSISALMVFKKGLPNIMGQKSSCGDPRTRKSVGYLILPHKTSTL